jgi:hypothetical protein
MHALCDAHLPHFFERKMGWLDLKDYNIACTDASSETRHESQMLIRPAIRLDTTYAHGV